MPKNETSEDNTYKVSERTDRSFEQERERVNEAANRYGQEVITYYAGSFLPNNRSL